MVSVGPYRLKYRGAGQQLVQRAQMLDRKNLAREEHQAQRRVIVLLEAAVLRQQARIEGAEYQIEMRSLGDELGQALGSLPISSPISTSVAPCLSGT